MNCCAFSDKVLELCLTKLGISSGICCISQLKEVDLEVTADNNTQFMKPYD